MIQPFQIGDTLLVHRLGRQATRLNTIRSLLEPYSALWSSLATVAPWNDGKWSTYVLRQRGHNLVRAGYLQAHRRPQRPESDIVMLAPGLDKAWGHPAIWEKLLSHYIQEATQHAIERIYVDAPDQPLPVASFEHVGFKVFTRQTIWRLPAHRAESCAQPSPNGASSVIIRPAVKQDEWSIQRLYANVVPPVVQRAEGATNRELSGDANDPVAPPLLHSFRPGACAILVLEEQQEVTGCIQIIHGAIGCWLQLLVDTNNPNTDRLHQMLQHALSHIWQRQPRSHVYIGVSDYQGGMSAILGDYGFAPFTDRAKMVKHLLQWAREPVVTAMPILEPVVGAVPTQFLEPRNILHAQKLGTAPRTLSSLIGQKHRRKYNPLKTIL